MPRPISYAVFCLIKKRSAWGPPVEWHGRAARAFLNYGSPFRKVSTVFVVPRSTLSDGLDNFELRVTCHTETACELEGSAFLDGREHRLAPIVVDNGRWH